MASPPHPVVTFSLLSFSLLFSTACAATCAAPKLKNSDLYKNCNELPTLKSSLHWTYTATNKTLSVAFTATPPASGGWVAWGINPTGTAMAGTQAILAYKEPNGSMAVKTYNISSYSSIVEGKLAFQVYDKRAEFNAGDGSITIFAAVKSAGGKVNHIWQVGPGVSKGMPEKHEFKTENLNSKASLDLSSAAPSGESETSGDAGLRKRNIHGILNAISWGILFPIGVIIARYLRTFDSADPVWFYLHVACQISAYAIGVAGWATGLQLGIESKGIVYTGHRCIGIVLFSLATLQIFALFLRPKKEHKHRIYWNIYHHSIGYAIIILGIINVFKGFDILQPEKKWKSTYTSILIALGALAVLLEAFTWIVVCRRKKSRTSAKPFA